jgi:hypothetical protein
MPRINDYFARYTGRGRSKAHRIWRGGRDVVPVAWDTDTDFKARTTYVWFEDIAETYGLLKAGKNFDVALAEGLDGRKNSSSDRIYRLLEVAPVEVVPIPAERAHKDPREWLRCTIIRECPRPERSDAPRPRRAPRISN